MGYSIAEPKYDALLRDNVISRFVVLSSQSSLAVSFTIPEVQFRNGNEGSLVLSEKSGKLLV